VSGTDVTVEQVGAHVGVVQLNRPPNNYFDTALIVGVAEAYEELDRSGWCRAIVLGSEGRHFCAGLDFAANAGQDIAALYSAALRLFAAPLPVVAAVQGAAIGGGTTMLTHCDFVYAGESAKFQMPFVNLALVPEFGSSCTVPARIGYLRAAELILLGMPFDANRAAELGLVTRVVPDQKLLATATETAQTLAEKPPGALQACKRLMKQSTREQLERAVKLENEEFSARVRSAEAKEAFTAFLEKRPPNVSGMKELLTDT